MKYNEHIETHELKQCENCSISFEKGDFDNHICSNPTFACEYCLASFPLNLIQDHMDYCQNGVIQCEICRNFILKKDYFNHLLTSKCANPAYPQDRNLGIIESFNQQARFQEDFNKIFQIPNQDLGNSQSFLQYLSQAMQNQRSLQENPAEEDVEPNLPIPEVNDRNLITVMSKSKLQAGINLGIAIKPSKYTIVIMK